MKSVDNSGQLGGWETVQTVGKFHGIIKALEF